MKKFFKVSASLEPGSKGGGEKTEPGTYCLRMRQKSPDL